jgi:hypothetical protein
MNITNHIIFWLEVAVVALESIHFNKNDTNSVQYFAIAQKSSAIIKNMKNNGIEKEELLKSVESFMNIKRIFSADPYSKTIPLNEVTPNLVALCVRYSSDIDITDDEYFQIVEEAKILSLNYFS